jgi:hypothetical protein
MPRQRSCDAGREERDNHADDQKRGSPRWRVFVLRVSTFVAPPGAGANSPGRIAPGNAAPLERSPPQIPTPTRPGTGRRLSDDRGPITTVGEMRMQVCGGLA